MLEQQPRHHNAAKREPLFNVSFIILALIAVCALIHGLRIYVLTPDQNLFFVYFSAFIPARYPAELAVSITAWTSLVSYSLIHADWPHLVNNALWLVVFGSPLANTIGAGRFILFWITCAAIAALFHYIGQPTDGAPMIGASGAVAGAMGAAARFGFAVSRARRDSRFVTPFTSMLAVLSNRSVITFLGIFLISNLIIASGQFGDATGTIAWQAHIGGIVAGFFLIPLFTSARGARK